MTMTDPIADLITRIRNAGMANKSRMRISYSKIKEGIVNTLQTEGFITSYEVVDSKEIKNAKRLEIELRYFRAKNAIVSIKRISRPGLRIYRGIEKLNEFAADRYSVTIVSTPKGVMTYQAARRAHLGGEILCVVR